jgi:hypothetical protein
MAFDLPAVSAFITGFPFLQQAIFYPHHVFSTMPVPAQYAHEATAATDPEHSGHSLSIFTVPPTRISKLALNSTPTPIE